MPYTPLALPSFSSQPGYNLSAQASGLLVTDLNRDGFHDLVVPSGANGTLRVLFGNGAGGVPVDATIQVSGHPAAVAAGDVNGDGLVDLVTANEEANTVSVLFGNGSGGFANPVAYAAGQAPASITMADLNGDGRPDLIVGSGAFQGPFGPNDASVLLNDGAGGFGAPASYTLAEGKVDAAAVDMTGDGVLDLVAVSEGVSYAIGRGVVPAVGRVWILPGDGTGGFAAASGIFIGNEPSAFAVADLNSDGLPDVVSAPRTGDAVQVRFGTGSGALGALTSFAAPSLPGDVAVTDINADGHPDILVGGYGADVTVLFGDGVGHFSPGIGLGPGHGGTGAVATADVNGDGLTDIVALSTAYPASEAVIQLASQSTVVASYITAPAGIVADLVLPSTNSGLAAGDAYAGVTGLIGSDFADALSGDGGPNLLAGGAGDDVINGNGGDDTLLGGSGTDFLIGGGGGDLLDGGTGIDTASYTMAPIGLVADLAAPSTNTGDAAGNRYIAIECLLGTAFADALSGDAFNNYLEGNGGADILNGAGGNDVLSGGEGDDVLIGGAGADTLNGGAGKNMADYLTSNSGLQVSLENPSINTGDAAGDVFIDIQWLLGSNFADLLVGEAGDNIINGAQGSDIIIGGAGNDTLIGGEGSDSFCFIPGSGLDYITDFTPGQDRLGFLASMFATPMAAYAAILEDPVFHTAFVLGVQGETIILNGVSRAEISVGDIYIFT